MGYNINERLSNLIFIELKDLKILDKISPYLYKELQGKDVLFPVDLKLITDKNNPKSSELTMDKFFVGMLLCIGGNENFIYNNYYEEIILNFDNSQEFYKGYIYSLIQKDELFEAYIMLKGLCKIYFNDEYKEKLIVVLINLKDKDEFFNSELKFHIDDAIKNYRTFNKVYLYKAMIERDEGNYVLALESIGKYKDQDEKGVKEFKEHLMSCKNYQDGKEKIYSSPKEALEKLIPLIDMFKNDALIYYYIAVAHRKLNMHQQAIYYLENSRRIDSDIVEVVNELGLNYAALGMYSHAIRYFEKVFKVTNSIESCTNMIMSYLKLNDMENVKKYFEIARGINKNDEILKELEKLIL
ncbi:TPR repeat-containing protein [Candidatus Arthromitus sp. SFB-rat-Yit]|nr:TPR repeat-containing protein [Candidatus Arthromitus sp. SFB-rat-Yit]